MEEETTLPFMSEEYIQHWCNQIPTNSIIRMARAGKCEKLGRDAREDIKRTFVILLATAGHKCNMNRIINKQKKITASEVENAITECTGHRMLTTMYHRNKKRRRITRSNVTPALPCLKKPDDDNKKNMDTEQTEESSK